MNELAGTIPEVMTEICSEHGSQTLLNFEGDTYSYGEIESKSNAVANSLLELGVQKGDTVALLMYNSPQYLIAMLGVFKTGAIAVPLDTRLNETDLEYAIDHSGTNVVILDNRTQESYANINPQIQFEFHTHAGPDQEYTPFHDLLIGDEMRPDVNISQGNSAAIHYTNHRDLEALVGGVLPHYSYINAAKIFNDNLSLDTDDCVYVPLPFFSVMVLQTAVVGALLEPYELVVSETFDHEIFWDQANRHEATTFLYYGRIPSILFNRSDNGVTNTLDYGVGFGADSSIIEEFEAVFDLSLIEGYGSIETGTSTLLNKPGERKIGSIGKPSPDSEVQIVGEDGWPLGPDQIGEIVVRPKRPNTMFSHYFKEPSKTLDVLENQWYHTGDKGYIDEDGFFYHISQEESIHRIQGNISALEIESVIEDHPHIDEAAVVEVPEWGDSSEIKAVIITNTHSEIDPASIIKLCQRELEYIKVPRYIEFRESAPRTPAGKIDRRRIDRNVDDSWDRRAGYDLLNLD